MYELKRINITHSSMPNMEEYIEEIKELWDSHWLTNMGVKHNQLELMLKDYLDTPYISLFANGHLALEMLLEAMNLQGEVITTPFTFVSTTHAIVRKGLKPVFCDINENDYTIDVNKLEACITGRTSAILPVHVYGNICDCEIIENIAKQYGIKVIYDAAHAFGVKKNGITSANFGDATMFSFHATKVFHSIEGGAVASKDKKLNKKLSLLKNFGITGLETIEDIGGNAKMNELQAAMGICNLRNVDAEINKRKIISDRYNERLSGVKGIKLCKEQSGVESNYSYFPCLFNGYKYTRDEVYELLIEQNIYARKYFYPLTNSLSCYNFDDSKTPVAKIVSNSILTLPLYSNLSLEDVDRICNIILI